MPPAGPNVADFIVDSMWGEEVECLSARLCSMGIPGELGTSTRVGMGFRLFESVFKLSWLGLRFMAGIVGLMKEGEEGSDTRLEVREDWNGGCIDRPFMLRRLGEGDVIGRGNSVLAPRALWFMPSLTERVFRLDERPPKDVAGNELSGIKLTGDSGDDEGDGSEREEVSVVKVVVGDESADSSLCVVVSW